MTAIFHEYKDHLNRSAEKLFKALTEYENDGGELIKDAQQLEVNEVVEAGNGVAAGYVSSTIDLDDGHHVKLNLNFLEMSNCSCAPSFYCEHELALFFYIYDEVFPNENLADNWQKKLSLLNVKKLLGIGTAGELMASEHNEDERKFQRWRDRIESLFDDYLKVFFKKNCSADVMREYAIFDLLVGKEAPNSSTWNYLYHLTAAIVTFKNVLMEMKNHKEVSEDISYLMDNLFDELNNNLPQLGQSAHSLHVEDFILLLRKEIEAAVEAAQLIVAKLDEDSVVEVSTHVGLFYKKTWRKLFNKTTWRNEELTRLATLVEHDNNDDKTIYLECQLQLLFLNKDDNHTLSLAEQQIELLGTNVIGFAHELALSHSWQRMELYVSYLTKHCQELLNNCVDDWEQQGLADSIMTIVRRYCDERGNFAPYEKTLLQMLPFSTDKCVEFYFNNEEYEKCIELIILSGKDFDALSAHMIETIMVANGRLVLPLYHQHIDKLISLRTRRHYTSAVKMLVQLRKLYVKLGEPGEWERFWNLLEAKTKRLRAFQTLCEQYKLSD